MKRSQCKLTLCQPAIYQIRIVGHLDSEKVVWFDNLTIVNDYNDEDTPITTITGEVADQAALHGLLNRICNLGLPLLSVLWLGSNSDIETPV
jgi:hypothetical protein